MAVRWGRVWVVSMGVGVSACVFRVLTGFWGWAWRPLGRPCSGCFE
ncbi:hypothetical protein PDR5_46910 [Pseudomonas sp. DR 5-09]|nr:hypothetical protein PDR5_46910 [Pseudomonas sp. DR 5-09]